MIRRLMILLALCAPAAAQTYTVSDASFTASVVTGACDTSLTNSTPTDGAQGAVVSSNCTGRNDTPVVRWSKSLTWEQMGVTPGHVVSQVDGSFLYRQAAESHTATQTVGPMQLFNGANSAACASADLESGFDPATTSSTYSTRDSGGARSVNAECSASNTNVTIRFDLTPATGNNTAANSELRVDDVRLVITAAPGSQPRTKRQTIIVHLRPLPLTAPAL
jgi:hypothetical protein